MANSSASDLHIVPLGAGDLIDRAVRLYRRHLFVLIRIATPPVLVSAVGWVIWTISSREAFSSPGLSEALLYLFLMFVAVVIIAAGHLFGLIVMGGASRNLVTHLLWNEPVLARTTYAAVRARFWQLLIACFIIMLWLVIASSVAGFGLYIGFILIALVTVVFAQVAPVWLTVILVIGAFFIGMAIAFWVFFFMVGRIAYVPQVMLVEGKGVFDSIARSFTLARGNIRRLMAMTTFIMFATYSALMILVFPLGLYGYLNGIDPSPWSASQWPVWYAIAYSVLEPLSSILLAPVWMLGMSLLYVDERVRHEGYDIELMASQRLDPMPNVNVRSPFEPAIFVEPPPVRPGSMLGLGR